MMMMCGEVMCAYVYLYVYVCSNPSAQNTPHTPHIHPITHIHTPSHPITHIHTPSHTNTHIHTPSHTNTHHTNAVSSCTSTGTFLLAAAMCMGVAKGRHDGGVAVADRATTPVHRTLKFAPACVCVCVKWCAYVSSGVCVCVCVCVGGQGRIGYCMSTTPPKHTSMSSCTTLGLFKLTAKCSGANANRHRPSTYRWYP